MDMSLSQERLAENEVYFRQPNERTVRDLDILRKIAEEENYSDLLIDENHPVRFLCECSDEKCHKRIELTPSKYRELHKNKQRFVVLPGHVVPQFEKVILSTKKYSVIEKYTLPPKKATKLHPTDLDHK